MAEAEHNQDTPKTPYYSDEFVTLWHGDAREIMAQLATDGQTFAAVITDPPYGETSLEWDRWPGGWPSIAATLSDQLWCFGSMRMLLTNLPEFVEWTYAQEIVWEKQNGSGFAADRFRRVHEFATHWYRGSWRDLHTDPQFTMDARAKVTRRKGKPTHMGQIESTPYVSIDGGPRMMRSVLQVRNTHGLAIHPTQKPLGILEPLISYSTKPGELIIDPFAGSGSTAVAASMLGRRTVLIESREEYCAAIVDRLAQGVLI